MIDFFEIRKKEFEKYKNRYALAPHKAYLKLMGLAFKYYIKTFQKNGAFKPQSDKINVALILHGGIGDILVGGLYASYLKRKIDDAELYIFSPNNTTLIGQLFHNQPFATNILDLKTLNHSHFDLVIELSLQIPRVVYQGSKVANSTFLLTYTKNLITFEDTHYGITTDDRQLNQLTYMLASGKNRISVLDVTGELDLKDDLILNVPENGKEIFKKYPELLNTPYVTISRGVDKLNNYKDSTRLWSISKYERLITLFKQQYPNTKIVYLGSSKEDCAELKGVDVDLVGKTTIPELMALLKQATLHFDMECGMVHLRHFLCRKPSVVLFGPTSPILKGYPENINLRRDDACILPMCEHIVLDGRWPLVCIKNQSCRGHCIESISEEQVLKETMTVLNGCN